MSDERRRQKFDALENTRPRFSPFEEARDRTRGMNGANGKRSATRQSSRYSLQHAKRARKEGPFPSRNKEQKAFQEQLKEYKYNLIDRLNEQMSNADEEVNQQMEELGTSLNQKLKVMDDVRRPFRHGIAGDRLRIEEEGKDCEEVTLGTEMADLERLVEVKSARLRQLAVEYTIVQRQVAHLTAGILGHRKVRIRGSSEARGQTPGAHDAKSKASHVTEDTAKVESCNEGIEHVYDDAQAGLIDLQNRLGVLVSTNLTENKDGLKAFEASRRSRQGEINFDNPRVMNAWREDAQGRDEKFNTDGVEDTDVDSLSGGWSANLCQLM